MIPVDRGSASPRFSIVTPLYNTTPFLLQEMVASVQSQTLADWELVLVDDASPLDETRVTARAAVEADSRVRLIELPVNVNISGATNAGIEASLGEFVALLDHDDTLDPQALELIAQAIDAEADIDYVYTDQDVMTEQGQYRIPFAKPAWSPERMLGQMYSSHLSAFRRSMFETVGLFRSEYNGSQDHDLVLRFTEQARAIAHVPAVLYHWRAVPGSTALNGSAKSYAWDAGLAAVRAAIERRGILANAEFGPNFGTYTIRHRTSPDVRVSIIIAGRPGLHPAIGDTADPLLSAISQSTIASQVLEVLIVEPNEEPSAGVLAGGIPVRTIQTGRHEDHTRLLQAGAIEATGDVLVFIDAGVRLADSSTLDELVGAVGEPDVHLAGPRIVFDNGDTKHAGYRLQKRPERDPFRGWPLGAESDYGVLNVNREVTAVSSECVAVRRIEFEAVGGFSSRLTGYCADVDLSLKLQSDGSRTLTLATATVVSSNRAEEFMLPEDQKRIIAARWSWNHVDAYTP